MRKKVIKGQDGEVVPCEIKRRKNEKPVLKEIDESLGIVEIFGRRVFWCKLGRKNHKFITNKRMAYGLDVMVYDMRYGKVSRLKNTKDYRRTCKYYYDWGEIDRLIYKYFFEKNKYRLEKGEFIDVKDLPDSIIEIRNQIIELLFNLINTIIYTHSFHQQINDTDLFQDSAEKLILLLDNDKHDPLRGTSFTFFTVALKNMIFTQIKKSKRYVNSVDSGKPLGKRDANLDDMDGYMEEQNSLQDLCSLYTNGFGQENEEEYPVDEHLEEGFTES